jgi:polysaccharide export outer membrane protein
VTSAATITPIIAETIVRLAQEGQGRSLGEAPPLEPHVPYHIGPRDVLTITVWDHPELTIPAGEFRAPEAAGTVVGENGDIFYPYVGTVHVAGMTLPELRDLLTQRLAKYIENPQLDVAVAAYRSQKAYVVGVVAKPGAQPISDIPLTVAEAINRAGGILPVNSTGGLITPEADLENVTLSRAGRTYHVDLLALYERGDLRQNVELKDGDVLSIPDGNLNKVFVLGEVKKPQSQFIHKGRMTLAESLSDAGGVDPLAANASRIYVIRHGVEKPEIFHLNARSPDALLLADRFALLPRDVVYVDTAPVADWNRVISLILPTAVLLYETSLTSTNINK